MIDVEGQREGSLRSLVLPNDIVDVQISTKGGALEVGGRYRCGNNVPRCPIIFLKVHSLGTREKAGTLLQEGLFACIPELCVALAVIFMPPVVETDQVKLFQLQAMVHLILDQCSDPDMDPPRSILCQVGRSLEVDRDLDRRNSRHYLIRCDVRVA